MDDRSLFRYNPGYQAQRIDTVLEMIHAAQASGVRLTADQYPYIAGSTMLGAMLPPWAHAGGVEATLARLASPDERQRMRREMFDRSPAHWDNFWKWAGPEGVVDEAKVPESSTSYGRRRQFRRFATHRCTPGRAAVAAR